MAEWQAHRAGEFCTPEQAIELTNWHIRKYLDVVDSTITRPMTVNQRGAMALMAYNIGPSAFAASSVAKRFNDGENLEHVAEAFGMWCKATNDVPDRSDIGKAYYDPIIGTNAKGQACWVGPATNPPKGWEMVREGDEFWAINPNPPPPHDPATGPPPEDQPPARIALGLRPRDYQKAMPGVLRRHLSEGMLFLNLDWRQACRKDTVSIVSQRIWDPNDKRWEDVVRTKTELSDILPLARPYPLPVPIESISAIQPTPAPQPAEIAPTAQAATQDSAKPVPQPAVPSAAVTSGSQPSPATQPATAGLPPAKTNSASAAESRPAPGSVAPPPSPSGAGASTLPKITPKATPPIATIQKPPSRYSVPITDAPYRIDPNFGLKPMEDSERWQASLAQNGGMIMMRFARYGFMGTGPATVATFIEKDPIFSGAFLALIGVAVMFSVGYVRKCYGDWRRHHAERVACQALV